jgi:peptidoglycan-associated lipoprotein
MKRLQVGVALISLMLVLGGCTKFGKKDDGSDDNADAAIETRESADDNAGAESYPVDDNSGFRGTELSNPDNEDNPALSQRIIYFDYDSAEVRADYRDVVSAHARFLSNNPTSAMTLEGHADERGSREYNLALAEQRANTIRRQMVLLGASAEQLRSVSYGEERPIAEGHDEQSYSQNRRVEIIY